MRVFYLTLSFLFYPSFVIAEPIKFRSADLGYELDLTERMTWLYNPHSMRKTPIYIGNTWVGGFTVSVVPETLTPEIFIKQGGIHYKDKYPNAKIVTANGFNRAGLEFHRISVEFEIDGKASIDERYIFVKQRISLKNKAPLNMTYTFNYKYKKNLYPEIKKDIKKPIDSFKLFENSPLTNEAIKLNTGF